MKPNVLIIHTDQHRQECLGAYGNREIQTPNIDSIAADGVLHRNHFCAFPICTPSRYSLLCGMYASTHLGISNQSTLPSAIATFASALRKDGYQTAAVGKMHFTPTYLDVGFDTMVLAEQHGAGRFDDDYHKYLRDMGCLDEIDLYDQRPEYRVNASAEYYSNYGVGCSDLPLEHHSTTYITNRACEQVERFRPEGGNLLMVGYIKPHHPIDPPEPYASMYNPDDLTLLPGYTDMLDPADAAYSKGYFDYSGLTEAQVRRAMAHYYGSITHIDDGVGKILDMLRAQGMYDNTLIIFTSDHGDYMGFRHMLLKGNYMYDPVAKIPLIIKYPKGWEKQGEDDALSSNVDIARTILSVCGVAHPKTMTGLDLTKQPEGRNFVICEHVRKERAYMVRSKTHKLFLDGAGRVRLFDLIADPNETNDIAGDPANSAIIAGLKDMLAHEFLFLPAISYRDDNAPVVSGLSYAQTMEQRRQMIAYMREASTVKPDDMTKRVESDTI